MEKLTKTERIHVLVSEAEKRVMNEAAQRMGLSLSSWVRLTLLAVARSPDKSPERQSGKSK